MYRIMLLALTICAATGFIYGLVRFFRKKTALYLRMIVFGVGCSMLGRLFETLQLFVNGQLTSGFHVGMLGIVGSFLFFFTANYGQMDSIVDDGSKQFRKYRLIGMIAPLGVIALYVVLLVVKGISESTVVLGVQSAVIALASYYHLKHLTIQDVDYGLIRSIRSYNLIALIYACLCMAEMLVENIAFPTACTAIVLALQCVAMLVIVPVLERGVKKWTT